MTDTELVADLPVRRTQTQRKEETLRKLFDATRESLIEVGYANTSVSQICKRSGVSHGGLFRHFKSRLDLIIAVAQDVSNALIDVYQARFAGLQHSKEPYLDALELLRKNCRERDNQAWFELLVAARGDAVLHDAMKPIWEENHERTIGYARHVFPNLDEEREDFESFIESIVYQFHGETINAFVRNDYSQDDYSLDFESEESKKVREADDRRLKLILDQVRRYIEHP